MHFTHNGIKLTILARHQKREHGCQSYFRGTMNADVECDRAARHSGRRDERLRHNLQHELQCTRGLHTVWTVPTHNGERLKAILH